MNNSNMFGTGEQMLEEIFKYVNNTDGLNFADCELGDYFIIEQSVDQRKITINKFDVEDVLNRVDEEGQEFLQVNFVSGKKVLLTKKLIGFRPLTMFGLDMEKLPKVVTTPDIMNIFDAIQESLCHEDNSWEELEVLRKVYDSVVCGGESVGFDLTKERELFSRIPTQVLPTSA
ncbi:MAG: hypothetical protein HRT44_00070 [Bdellovibrionales bacterium]|nr:hypothetical protein [Bdellovibrionales bacterium]